MNIRLWKPTLEEAGILLFLLSMYSIGTVSSITVSWTFTLLLLGSATLLLFLNYALDGGKEFSTAVIGWAVLTAFCGIGFLRGSPKTLFVFYMLCLVILAVSSMININTLRDSFKWIKVFGLFFAFGCYWQYLFPNQYYSFLYPRFGAYYQKSIRRQFTFHKMCTGFTSQTAVAAEFIVLGLMIVLYSDMQGTRQRDKAIAIAELIVLAGGFLLTGKRGPLLCLISTIIIVDLLTRKRSKRGSRLLNFAMGAVIAATVVYFFAPLFSGSRNSIVRFIETISEQDIGEISNGRIALSSTALSEFRNHVLFGIGWGKFSRLYDITGVHNIYMQLLCECGLVGAIPCIIGLFVPFFQTVRIARTALHTGNETIIAVLRCSLFMQYYILVYGLFGNPIYDENYLLMYLLGLVFSISANYVLLNPDVMDKRQ